MSSILSIQSHVAYGYVGNRAAALPLQIMGYEVVIVNTVQFSNHTGYGEFTGQIFETDHITDILAGLEARGLFHEIGAVLSGYLGTAALGAVVCDAVEKIRTVNPGLLYCCDPVMGDTGRGFFVKDDLPPFFTERALHDADIITPNQFELSHLAGVEIKKRADAQAACAALHKNGADKDGPSLILLTSLETAETGAEEIQMMVSHKDGRQWLVTTPKLPLSPAPNGAGDMTAALFLGHIMAGKAPDIALENTAASVFGIFEKTASLGRRELALVQGQDCFRKGAAPFKAQPL